MVIPEENLPQAIPEIVIPQAPIPKTGGIPLGM